MKAKVVYSLIFFLLAGVVIFQAISLVVMMGGDDFSTHVVSINNASKILSAAMLLIVAIMVSLEIRNLEEFKIDKFTLSTLMFFSILRLLLERGSISNSIMIGLACFLMAVSIFLAKPKPIRTDLRWASLGIAIGTVAIFPIILFGLSLQHTWSSITFFQKIPAAAVVGIIIKQLSFTTVPEEILFRGFIWGYLNRRGWRESKIIWAQGVLFWLIHFSRLVTPLTFFVSIPILTLISSQLTKYSKQVFPAILSHTVINVIGTILNVSAI